MTMPLMLLGYVLVVTLPGAERTESFARDYYTRTACEAAAARIDAEVAPRCVPRNDYYRPREPRVPAAATQSAYPWRHE